jgi:hypothetical protein
VDIMTLLAKCGWIASAASLSMACAAAPVVPAKPDVATVELAGVRIFVSADSWQGDPANLSELYTPVLLRVENHSGKAVRIAYRDMRLHGSSGSRYRAVSPQQFSGIVPAAYSSFEPAVGPRFDHDRFFVDPEFSYREDSIPHDDGHYRRRPEPWATPDMIAEALPEGAVDDGGLVSGFVYFPALRKGESADRFVMVLPDADGGPELGRVSIPFPHEVQR